MTDFYKMSSIMKEIFPVDPEADRQALKAMAGNTQENVAPTKNYVQESVEVSQGSMPLEIDSISDFAKLAGIVTEGRQKTGSAGQAKGSDATPKMSKPSSTGEQPHPLKDKLVGEEDDIANIPGVSAIDDLLDNNMPAALVSRALSQAVSGQVLAKREREALAPYAKLFVTILNNPSLRTKLVAMNSILNKKDKPKEEESIKEKLYRELKKFK